MTATKEETLTVLTCSTCGNTQKFLVKTLQMHVVYIDGENIDTAEEDRPAVLELLCDECENELNIDDLNDSFRKELLLTLGAR